MTERIDNGGTIRTFWQNAVFGETELPVRRNKSQRTKSEFFYTVDMILDSIVETHRATRKWPGRTSGIILHGPLADGKRTWSSVDEAMHQIWKDQSPLPSCNGLTRENCPYSSLTDLKDRNKLNDDYGFPDIKASLIASFERTRIWPTKESGLILDGPLANGGRTWISVDEAMKQIWKPHRDPEYAYNGLTQLTCPARSLADAKKIIMVSMISQTDLDRLHPSP